MAITRRQRRAIGKRELYRRAHADVSRIIELERQGISTKAISSSLKVGQGFIDLVLEHAQAVEEAEEKSIATTLPPGSDAIEPESGGTA